MDLDNMIMVYWLVVSNMALEFSMSHMGDIILPIDELVYFSRWLLHHQPVMFYVYFVWATLP